MKNKKSNIKINNLVAKYANRLYRHARHKDKKNDYKRYEKHKRRLENVE